MHTNDMTKEITELIVKAAEKARKETSGEAEPDLTKPIDWPIDCVVGPGLEGAIACESKIGYVNGTKGWLIYRGYDIFDLCINSSYEEVSYLLIHGEMPTEVQLKVYKKKLFQCFHIPATLRLLLSFSIEDMHPMAILRLGLNLLRQEFTKADLHDHRPTADSSIATDADTIAMEFAPRGEEHAIFEFKKKRKEEQEAEEAINSCYRLISAAAAITAAMNRIRSGHYPIDPDPELGFAANLLYMMTGKRPNPVEERIMDVALILHADHGMNASTFAAMVVASTLSDIYYSIGSGTAALSGPLHGGANEEVIKMLKEIGSVENVKPWFEKARQEKRKIPGFGHRVYKAYDPRARILSPLAQYLTKYNKEYKPLFDIAQALEKEVVTSFGKEKKIFPNVDFYSGIVYHVLGVPAEMFTPIFTVSRVAGWTARVSEYLENNRIFRPRAMYIGPFNKQYVSIEKRHKSK
jgi:citrate synthase